jgi:hypothetical protein
MWKGNLVYSIYIILKAPFWRIQVNERAFKRAERQYSGTMCRKSMC